MNNEIDETVHIDTLFDRIATLIEKGRQRVATAVNIAEVYTKYSIGQYIVEDEQQGEVRAKYGKQIPKELSERLTNRFGDGWSVETLTLCRKFYSVYSNLVNSVYEIAPNIQNAVLEKGKQCLPTFTLSWSHYLILMRVDNPDARSFYEIECAQQQWSV